MTDLAVRYLATAWCRWSRFPAAVALTSAVAILCLAPARASAHSGLHWHSAETVDARFGQPFSAVACPSASLCVGLNQAGEAASTTDPAAGAGGWKLTAPLQAGIQFANLACPSADFCVAVNQPADSRDLWIATTATPTGHASAWTLSNPTLAGVGGFQDGVTGLSCPSTALCVLGTTDGLYISTDPAEPDPSWQLGLPLSDGGGQVSCPTASFCVYASSVSGLVLASDDPAGGKRTWTQSASGLGPITSLACPSTTECVAISGSGELYSSGDPAAADPVWSDQGQLPGASVIDGEDDNLIGPLSCSSSGVCVMVPGYVDEAPGAASLPTTPGEMLTSSDPLGAASAWTVTDGVSDSQLLAVSCAPVGFCAAATQSGAAATSSTPTAGESAWTVSEPIGPVTRATDLTGISCPSAALCVATDADGDIASARNPGSHRVSWHTVAADPGADLRSISCPSARFCAAIGSADQLATSTDPTGGASAWDPVTLGLSWSYPNTDGGLDDFASIACPSAQFCIAPDTDFDDVAASHDPAGGPGAWSTPYAGQYEVDQFSGVSCVTVRFCVAVGVGGDALTTASRGRVRNVAGANLSAVSCPTASLCVATSSEDVWVGSPSHTSHWSAARLEPSAKAHLTGVDCASTRLCVATDDLGRVFLSTDPGGGSSAWRRAQLDPGNALAGVACPSPSLCAVVGADGKVIVGTR